MENYTDLRLLGRGGFGKVYLATLVNNRYKDVVLKEVDMFGMQKKEKDEARKEVGVLAQLNHSNIVSYLDNFEAAGKLYIAMDYCDGGDLSDKINEQEGTLFSEEQVLDWFVQMCLAVKHIHDRKILHRDIKPKNIFLTRRGIIKLGDFGISKVLNSTLEACQTVVGTMKYSSPEKCKANPYNNKSDIWSLGCVLYELTTLNHPFEAGNNMSLQIAKIERAEFTPPSDEYSVDLRSLIAEFFKINPEERPSVDDILKKSLLQEKIRKYSDRTVRLTTSKQTTSNRDSDAVDGLKEQFESLGFPVDSQDLLFNSVLQDEIFLRCLECQYDLLDHLRYNGCITDKNSDELKQKNRTERECNNALIKLINPSNVEKFKQGLEKSNQSHLVNFINKSGKREPPEDEEWPASDSDLEPITNSYPTLVRDLDYKSLLDQLLAEKCLSAEQMNTILSKDTTEARNRELLAIVKRRSIQQLKIFLICVQRESPWILTPSG